MTAIKTKQDDLRRLMKERRENLTKERIDSPFAKYSSSNQLSCIICNVTIKHNNLWTSHIAGKTHKENITKQQKSNTVNDTSDSVVIGVKRNLEQSNDSKKFKNDDVFKIPLLPKEDSKTSKSALLASYSSSSDDDSDMDVDVNSEITSSNNCVNSTLPADFFDNSAGMGNTASTNDSLSNKKETLPVPSNNVETLPEGFFDDPVLDAKARNIEYKDPVEEEWEKFQKTIAEETNVSKTIIEEDLEESTFESGIDQIDEQMHQWERSKNLQSLVDTLKSKTPKKEKSGDDSGSDDEDLDDDDLLDWRSKGLKKL